MERNSFIFFKDFTDLDFFYTDFFSFSFTNACLPCRLRKTYTVRWAANRFVGPETHNFENVNSISNIFQGTHDFLVLADPLIICIYLRTTDRHFRDQGNARHLTSKLRKWDLLQTLNTSQKPSLWIVAAGKSSFVI